jgi:WD40 repeat protein
LATASLDNTAWVWDVTTGQKLAVLTHQSSVNAIALSLDGRVLATASDDKTPRIWNAATGQERAGLTHQGSVSTVAVSPDGRTLAAASDDKTVRLVTLPPSDIFELIDYARRKLPIGRTELSKSERGTEFLPPVSADR